MIIWSFYYSSWYSSSIVEKIEYQLHHSTKARVVSPSRLSDKTTPVLNHDVVLLVVSSAVSHSSRPIHLNVVVEPRLAYGDARDLSLWLSSAFNIASAVACNIRIDLIMVQLCVKIYCSGKSENRLLIGRGKWPRFSQGEAVFKTGSALLKSIKSHTKHQLIVVVT